MNSLDEGKYIIKDSDGIFSSHKTINNAFQMVKEDYLKLSDLNEEEKTNEWNDLSELTTLQKRNFLEDYADYEILSPNPELVREWEEYHNKVFGDYVKEGDLEMGNRLSENVKNVVYYVEPDVDIDKATPNEVFLVYENNLDMKVGFSPTYGHFSFSEDGLADLSKCTKINVDKYKELSNGFETPVTYLEKNQEKNVMNDVYKDVIKEIENRFENYKQTFPVKIPLEQVIEEVVYEDVDPDDLEELEEADKLAELLINNQDGEKFRFGRVVNQDLTMERKEKAFSELLVSELLKEEHEYCFDKSYMSDDVWEKRYGSLDRASAYLHRTSDLVGKVSSGKLVDILSEYDHDRFDHLYEKVRNIDGYKLDKYDSFIIANPDGEFMKEKNVEALMKSRFFSLGEVEEVHSMKLLSDDERVEFLRESGFRVSVPTYEGVKEWEKAFDGESFYRDIKEISVEESLEIMDMYDVSPDDYLGRFYYKENEVFVGVDNSGGMCWTEEFKSLNHCMEWLGGAEYSNGKDLEWYKKEELVSVHLSSLTSQKNVRSDYNSRFIYTLDKDVQNGVRASLRDSIRKDGVYSSEEIDLLIEDGMHSRISDLEDTIDVYGVIDNVLKERESYHESTLETLDSFYEDQLDYFKNQEKNFVDPRINALSSVADSHPDFAFNGDELDHKTLKVWIKRKEEQLFGSESTSELGSNNDLTSSTKKLKDIGMER